MIKALVLDVGGVIIRTESQEARLDLEQEFKLPPGSLHNLVFESPVAQSASVGAAGSSEIWKPVVKKLSLTPDELTVFIEKFFSGDKLDRALVEFLESCRDSYKTALLSNAWDNLRAYLSNTYNIKEGQTVDHILISAELGVAKPDPKIYEILADQLECEFEEILFVDDFIENINSAASLGIKTIHFQPGMDLINEIKSKLE